MKKNLNLISFFSEVREQAGRVTWASRQEVAVMTFFVFCVTLVASIYFFFVDALLSLFITWCLG